MSELSRESFGQGARGEFSTNRETAGFTLIELMVVLALMTTMAAIAYMGYREGLYREYKHSAQMRSLITALHLAQWRALKGGIAIPIAKGQSVNLSNGWYHGVELTTAVPHDFQVGDWVTFSDLAGLPPGTIGHSGLNVGRYCVTSVGMGSTATTFQVSYVSQIPPNVNDIPTSPPYPSPAPVPMVRNATGASKLVIMKRSAVNDPGELADPQNFVYNDQEIFIWVTLGNANPSGAPTDATYTLTLRFTSRGLPADPAGYQLAVGDSPADYGSANPGKLITVTPTGKISPGSS